MASPRPIISAIPVKKPRLTRSGLPPPVFWATKTDTASAPLSPKGVGESLNAGGGGKGVDGVRPLGVYRPLDQQLADVHRGLVEGGHYAEGGRPPEHAPVHLHISPANRA